MKKILKVILLIILALLFHFIIFASGYLFGTDEYIKGTAFLILSAVYVMVIFHKAKASITEK